MWLKYMHVSLEIWGSVFCLIAAMAVFVGSDKEKKEDKWMLILELTVALLLCMDSLAWRFRGYPGDLGRVMVYVSNFIVFVLSYVILAEYTTFLYRVMEKDTNFPVKMWINAVYGICIFGIILVIANCFTGMFYYIDSSNFYHRSDNFFITQVLAMVGMAFDGALLWFCRKCFTKRMLIALVTYMLFPFISLIVQLFIYGVSFLNISVCLSMLMIFISWEIEKSTLSLRRAQKVMEQEQIMSELKTDIMMSQIQPHFLMNSLTAIARLCDKNPASAKEATLSFAEYLRGNINALKSGKLIPFKEELEHVKHYVYLEQLRFGNSLKVEYKIESQDFLIPPLSVQPLVENAIKHGIEKKGTVILKTGETEENFVIMVEDDGIGMMKSVEKKDKHTHIGIDNVRKRLDSMCEGTLEYSERDGGGTCATIKIPK